MRLILGIDDTDNLESRGTGFHVRELATALEVAGLATPVGVTRHQLLVDPRIPYTSHNSSAAVEVSIEDSRRQDLGAFCRAFLVQQGAPGSDVGLCVAAYDEVTAEVERFGARAKAEVLTQAEANELAIRTGIQLWGLTGTHGGVIGALAAVGLHAAGNDGRFLWLPGLRELSGVHAIEDLERLAGIQAVRTLGGVPVPPGTNVDVGDWPRPVLEDGRAVLLVEEGDFDAVIWRTVDRDLVKERSS